MGKKIRLEFEYEEGLLDNLQVTFPKSNFPKISIITRMTEHDISEGPIRMVECTEIIHEN